MLCGVASLETQNIADVLKRQIGEKIVKAVNKVAKVASKKAVPLSNEQSFHLPANIVDDIVEKPSSG